VARRHVVLDPEPAPGSERSRIDPGQLPGAPPEAREDVVPVVLALVVALVLDSDQACLRPSERPPLRDPPDAAPVMVDAPEKVGRREEDQVPAPVAVAGNQVVGVAG